MTIERIRRTITVKLPPDDAFRLFTDGLDTWWPLDRLSIAIDVEGRKTERVVFEGVEGGRIYEVMSDGTEADWGKVRAWEPGRRLVMAWKPNTTNNPSTEVEVTFVADEGGGTRVDLEHRMWELLGPDLGREARAQYASGWPLVFERFGRAGNGAPEAAPR
jgi:uncharacterized protein YndB with AHSA1/START domain